MLSQQDLNITLATKNDNESLFKKLNDLIRRLLLVYRNLRADTKSVTDKVDAGVASGWFDDGTNFRITVTNGIITAIEDSSGAGHS